MHNSIRFSLQGTHSILFTIIFALLILLSGCGENKQRLYPFGWTSIDPEFDSLTIQAERSYLDFRPDSVIEPLIEKMEKMAKEDPSSQEKLSRYHYWHARLRLRHGEVEEAMDEFLVALALTDSARNPYDVARIRWNMELEEPEGVEGYFATLGKLKLFKEFNDLPMQAAYNMTLGAMMTDVGNPAASLRYFNSADSLLKLSSLYGQAARNHLNRAKVLDRSGREKEAAALLRDALRDSLFCLEPVAVNIAQWNLYLITDSLPLLEKAYRELDSDLDSEEWRPVYASFLLKEYGRMGLTDSVRKLMPVVMADTATIRQDDHRRDIFIGLAEGEKALGNKDKSIEYFEKAFDVVMGNEQQEGHQNVVRLEQRHVIDEATHKLEIQNKDRTLWLMVALVAVIVIAAVIIIIYRRRLERKKEESLRASISEEQAKRRVLALEIAMEENRRLGENIRETVGSLEKEGRVDSSVQGALEATLKSHDIRRSVQDDFVSTFGDVNPAFLEALDKKYPNLSKTERRLAVYISLSLDNKHISRLTGVRPESVKQARWRLRNKLALPEGVTLEEEMKSLMGKL
ncbi:MAG: hypothetical protein K2N05_09265 [Muribaculaceae bacterium]|nr:hypothetical protein [Muribaculaceae bacterium]